MTAGPEVLAENASNEQQETEEFQSELPAEINEIFDFLSSIKEITFKSQQIDDPELEREEKVKIAHDIYKKSRHTFLMRFGGYFQEEHLDTFEDVCILNNEEQNNEMKLMIEDYRQRLKTRQLLVKNRRYAAMQELIAKGDYFSELEMMKRSPELYEELVGQYMSEAEKKLRDRYDVKNTSFSGILMHTMQQREMNDLMQEIAKQNRQELKQVNGAIAEVENQNSSSDSSDEEVANDVPINCRQQWGNFDNEQIACSTSRPTKAKPKLKDNVKHAPVETYMTAGERKLLRHEFLGLMHEQFLAGGDEDFDYDLVDNDSKLDDLNQLNQDKEDAYFEASDEDDYDDDDNDNAANHASASTLQSGDDDESEDELDTFMKHLSKHHSLQQN